MTITLATSLCYVTGKLIIQTLTVKHHFDIPVTK